MLQYIEKKYQNDGEIISIINRIEKDSSCLGDYNSLLEVLLNVNDKELARKVILIAKEKLETAESAEEFIDPSILNDLESFIKALNDEELVKEILEIVLDKSIFTTNLIDSGRLSFSYIEDKDFNNEYAKKIIDKASATLEYGYYSDLYIFIKDDLEDDYLANEFMNNNIKMMMEEDEEFEYGLIDNKFEHSASTCHYIRIEVYIDASEGNEDYLTVKGHEKLSNSISLFIDKLNEQFDIRNDGINILFLDDDDNSQIYKKGVKISNEDIRFRFEIDLKDSLTLATIDKKLLEIDDKCFTCWITAEDEYEEFCIIRQIYDRGEYDTGYFVDGDDGYIFEEMED